MTCSELDELANDPGRIARDDDISRRVLGDHTAGTNDAPVADGYPGQMIALPPIHTSSPIVTALPNS